MAFLNIFKRKKKIEKKPEKKVKEKMREAGPRSPKPTPLPPKPKKISDIAYRVLKGPHVTEKATDLTQKNQYVFGVSDRANKTEIKKAVEDTWGVNVTGVRIIRIPPKKRKLGRIEGWRQGYKKAIVKIAAGQKIEVLPR